MPRRFRRCDHAPSTGPLGFGDVVYRELLPSEFPAIRAVAQELCQGITEAYSKKTCNPEINVSAGLFPNLHSVWQELRTNFF